MSTTLLGSLVQLSSDIAAILAPVLRARYRLRKEKAKEPSLRSLLAINSSSSALAFVESRQHRIPGLVRQAFQEAEVPDVLRTTARLITDPESAYSYQLVEHAIIVGLREAYGVSLTEQGVLEWRESYERLLERSRQKAVRDLESATALDRLMLDVLVLQGWTRRSMAIESAKSYYESFRQTPFGVSRVGNSPARTYERDQSNRTQYKGLKLPDFSHILGSVFALKLGINGLDDVLGGLMPSFGGGLVTLLIGPAGAGKTTLALTLASRLAELGAHVGYFSTEESVGGLRAKNSLITKRLAERLLGDDHAKVSESALARLEFAHVVPARGESVSRFLGDILKFGEEVFDEPTFDPYAPVAKWVILDSVTGLLREETKTADDYSRARSELQRALAKARERELNLLLVGQLGDDQDAGLEYLVDNVFALDFKRDDLHGVRERTLLISKTRQQASHAGPHALQITPRQGCVVSPSLETVLDALRSEMPRERESSDVRTKIRLADGLNTPNWLVSSDAQVLVHGQGSAGKARFALAMAAKLSKQGTTKVGDRRPVLVISFLHEQSYYVDIWEDLRKHQYPKTTSEDWEKLLKVQWFTPGLLRAESFVTKIRETLDSLKYLGTDVGAVVIDGVHNLVMQFPRLQHEPLLWPCLFRLTRQEKVPTVSTFTFWGHENDVASGGGRAGADFEIPTFRRAGEALFHHLLVSSSDYTFVMNGRPFPIGVTFAHSKDEPASMTGIWDARSFQIRQQRSTSSNPARTIRTSK